MKKISYIPFSKKKINHYFDYRNILLYSKLKGVKIEEYDKNKNFDIIVLPPSYDPTDLTIFKSKKIKIVYHLVDNYLAVSTFSLKNIFRGLFFFLTGNSKKITFNYKKSQMNLCKLSHAVICASLDQKNIIKKINKNCYIFFEGNFHASKAEVIKTKKITPFKIVWEGRSENLSHLMFFVNAFKILAKKYRIELHIITDLSYPLFNNFINLSSIKKIKKIFGNYYHENIVQKRSHIYIHQWNLSFVSTILKSCDLAIIPLNQQKKFISGKSMNKLIHMWRNNLPTICSDIGSYRNIAQITNLDICCNNTNEWVKKIERIINDEKYKNTYIKISSKFIAENYSTKHFILQWDKMFDTLN